MHSLTDRQQSILANGLSAFDEATRRRRIRRRVVRGALVALVAGSVGLLMLLRPNQTAGPQLPAYVELIRDDQQLAAELELANACERVNRNEGRLVVVECMVPDAAEPAPVPAGDVRPVG